MTKDKIEKLIAQLTLQEKVDLSGKTKDAGIYAEYMDCRLLISRTNSLSTIMLCCVLAQLHCSREYIHYRFQATFDKTSICENPFVGFPS